MNSGKLTLSIQGTEIEIMVAIVYMIGSSVPFVASSACKDETRQPRMIFFLQQIVSNIWNNENEPFCSIFCLRQVLDLEVTTEVSLSAGSTRT